MEMNRTRVGVYEGEGTEGALGGRGGCERTVKAHH